MIETKTFSLKSLVKDSCMVVEFRVRLEKKGRMEKYLFTRNIIRVTRRRIRR